MTTPPNRPDFPIHRAGLPARAQKPPRPPGPRHGPRVPALLACACALCCTIAVGRGTRAAHAAPPAKPAASSPAGASMPGDPPSPGAYGRQPPTDDVVYRCGTSYSPHPCGAAAPLDVADPRTAAQRQQAADIAARDKRLASWLAAQRPPHESPAAV